MGDGDGDGCTGEGECDGGCGDGGGFGGRFGGGFGGGFGFGDIQYSDHATAAFTCELGSIARLSMTQRSPGFTRRSLCSTARFS
mgnify:CR=1 FL=1